MPRGKEQTKVLNALFEQAMAEAIAVFTFRLNFFIARGHTK